MFLHSFNFRPGRTPCKQLAPQCPIFSFVFANEFGAFHSLVQASETIISHSSHRSHFSSNVKLGTPLFCGPPSSFVCINNGQWSEAWENRCVMVLAGNFTLHSIFATARSNLSLVFALPDRLLFHVKGYPLNPISNKPHKSRASRKLSICLYGGG